MIELKSFEELIEVQTKLFSKCDSLDLFFIRICITTINGFLFVIGADALEELKFYFMYDEIYNSLSSKEKEYIKRNYDGF